MKNILILLLVLIMASCSTTKYVEVPIEVNKKEYINHVVFDSIYIHDSIDRYIANDTVFLTRYKYIYKYINTVDTVIKIDSIDKPVYIPKYIDREVIKYTNKLNQFLKILIYIGIFSVGLFLILIISYLHGKFRRI